MRRRRDPGELPPELIVFEGFRYSTAAEWRAALDEFDAARRRWAAEHGVKALPERVIDGDSPMDWSII